MLLSKLFLSTKKCYMFVSINLFCQNSGGHNTSKPHDCQAVERALTYSMIMISHNFSYLYSSVISFGVETPYVKQLWSKHHL